MYKQTISVHVRLLYKFHLLYLCVIYKQRDSNAFTM